MVTKYMKARKLTKLLHLLKEFDLDPRELKKEITNLQEKLKETQSNLEYMCTKVEWMEKQAKELEKPETTNKKEEGLTPYETYMEMMTGIPTVK